MIEVLFAQAAREFCVAALFSHDCKLDAGSLENLHHCAGDAPRTSIVACCTADPIKNIVVFPFLSDWYIKPLSPVHSFIGIKPPGVPYGSRILQRFRSAFREFALLKGKMPAQADDEIRRLDVCWTDCRTGAAGGAGEKFVLSDYASGQVVSICVIGASRGCTHTITQLQHDGSRFERRSCANSGANVIAAAAFDAGVELRTVSPREILDGRNTEVLLFFNILNFWKCAVGSGFAYRNSGWHSVDMGVISERYRSNEGESSNAVNHPKPDMCSF